MVDFFKTKEISHALVINRKPEVPVVLRLLNVFKNRSLMS